MPALHGTLFISSLYVQMLRIVDVGGGGGGCMCWHKCAVAMVIHRINFIFAYIIFAFYRVVVVVVVVVYVKANR